MNKSYWIELQLAQGDNNTPSIYRSQYFDTLEEAKLWWRENQEVVVSANSKIGDIIDIAIYQQTTTKIYPLL